MNTSQLITSFLLALIVSVGAAGPADDLLPVLASGGRKLLKKPGGNDNTCVPFTYPGDLSCDSGQQQSSRTIKTKGYHLSAGGYATTAPDNAGCTFSVSTGVSATNEPTTIFDPATGQLCTVDGSLNIYVSYYTSCQHQGGYSSHSTSLSVGLYGNDALSHITPKKLPSSISGTVPARLCSDSCEGDYSGPPNCQGSCSDSPLQLTLDLDVDAPALQGTYRCQNSYTFTSSNGRCLETVETKSNAANFNLKLSGTITFTSPDPAVYGNIPEPIGFITTNGAGVTGILSKDSTTTRTAAKPAPPPA